MNGTNRTTPLPWVYIAHIAVLAIAAGLAVYASEAAFVHHFQQDPDSAAGRLHKLLITLMATGVNLPLLAAAATFIVGLAASWLSHQSSFTFPYHVCDPADLDDINIIDERFCGAHSPLNETLVAAARLHHQIHSGLIRRVSTPLYHYQVDKNWSTLVRITLLSAVSGVACYASNGFIIHYVAQLPTAGQNPASLLLLQYLVQHDAALHILAPSLAFAAYALLAKPLEVTIKFLTITVAMASILLFLATAHITYANVQHNHRLSGHSTEPAPKNLEKPYPEYDPRVELSDTSTPHQLPQRSDTLPA